MEGGRRARKGGELIPMVSSFQSPQQLLALNMIQTHKLKQEEHLDKGWTSSPWAKTKNKEGNI